MKNELWFWNDWYRPQRILYVVLLGLFFISLALCIASYLYGLGWISGWETITQIKSIKYQLDTIYQGILSLPVDTEMFVSEQYHDALPLQIPIFIPYLFGFCIWIAAVYLLAVATKLEQVAFAIVMTVFIFYLSYLNLDYFQVFYLFKNSFLILLFLLFLGVCFYYHSLNRSASLQQRFFVLLCLSLLFGLWVHYKSALPFPFVSLANYGLVFTLLLTMVFITLTSQDLIYGFLHLIIRNNPNGGRNNLYHFAAISLFYWVNLLLIFLQESGFFKLNIFYFDIYWLFFISSVLGIWGFRRRRKLTAKYLPFDPAGAFGYLGLGLIAFATLAYAFATGNDPLQGVIRDFMLYSYIAFGFLFFLYVLANFSALVSDKMDITDVVYEGVIFPFYLMRLMALVVIAGFYIGGKQYMYAQTLSGYYNAMGDIHLITKDYRLAKEYYELSTGYDYYNFRAHFSLATLYRRDANEIKETIHLRNTLVRLPTPYVYARLSNLYLSSSSEMNALLRMKEGIEKFPNNLRLNNLAGLLFLKNGVRDSAIHYLEKAEKMQGPRQIPRNNLIGLLAGNIQTQPANELPQLPLLPNAGLEGKVNLLAFQNAISTSGNNQNNLFEEPGKADEINFAYTYNAAINGIFNREKQPEKVIQAFLKADKKENYATKLQFVRAVNAYYSGNTRLGIELLSAIPVIVNDSYFNTMMGLWMLEQSVFHNASSYFEKAIELGNDQAKLYQAICLSEAGEDGEAFELWKELAMTKNKEVANLAARMLKILGENVELENDTDKYLFIRYKKRQIPAPALEEVYKTIQDLNFKTQAAAELMHLYLDKMENAKAEELYASLQSSPTASVKVKSDINFAYLRLLAANKEYNKLLKEIDELPVVNVYRNKKPYFKALAYQSTNRFEQAEKKFNEALSAASFDEEVMIGAAEFYRTYKKNIEKCYEILVRGVRLNPNSAPLLKAYAFASLQMNLDFYAEDALQKLKTLLDAEEFTQFEAIFMQKQKESEETLKQKLNAQ